MEPRDRRPDCFGKYLMRGCLDPCLLCRHRLECLSEAFKGVKEAAR